MLHSWEGTSTTHNLGYGLVEGSTCGGGIDSSGLPQFSLDFRLVDLESNVFYENDKRKIQEVYKILARML